MNPEEFDLNLFLQSFKDMGATIKPGTGKIILNGKEIDPMKILQDVFSANSDKYFVKKIEGAEK